MPVIPLPAATPPAFVPGGTSKFTALDIVTQAMAEILATNLDETPQAADAEFGLKKLNRLLDAWNADGRYVWTVQFNQYPITPNLQPHTIGPNPVAPFTAQPVWVVNQRPVKLVEANIILNTVTPPIRYPMNVRDAAWWAAKRSYAVTGTLPTDVYYEPEWPLGFVYIWPVPLVAYNMELITWALLNEVQLNTTVSLPQGYADALIYNLAVSICPSFGKLADPVLIGLATRAIQIIWGPNIKAPRMGTKDNGMPGGDNKRATFNYLTGESR